MKNVILGMVAGLVLGTAGALAYSHYLGDGKLLDDLQTQLDAANASLAKLTHDKQQLANETSGVSDQVDQLEKSNEDLKKQLDDAKTAPPPTATALAVNPMAMAGMMMGMFRGGRFQTQQRLFLLQTRLKLTPDQATKIKAAMDADAKAQRDVMQQMFRNNGKIDPQAAAKANTLDQTLASVLTLDQQSQYQQVQADEKASRADTSATVQVNQVAPLLQLSDSQKDQLASALYQVQISAPDPTSLMTNPNAMSVMAAQAKATQDAMAKVLTPDQMTIYQQAAQSFQPFGGGGRGGPGGGNGGGTPNANSAGGGATAAAAPTTTGYVVPPGGTTPVSTTVTTAVVSPDASATSGSTNAATTNAAPTQ